MRFQRRDHKLLQGSLLAFANDGHRRDGDQRHGEHHAHDSRHHVKFRDHIGIVPGPNAQIIRRDESLAARGHEPGLNDFLRLHLRDNLRSGNGGAGCHAVGGVDDDLHRTRATVPQIFTEIRRENDPDFRRAGIDLVFDVVKTVRDVRNIVVACADKSIEQFPAFRDARLVENDGRHVLDIGTQRETE